MIIKVNKIFLFLFVTFFLTIFQLPLYASSLKIEFQNGLLDITAEEVPMVQILKQIANKTDITILSQADLDEQTSCNLKESAPEDTIRNLLKNHNFVMLFKKVNNTVILDTVKIMGGKSLASLNTALSGDNGLAEQDNDGNSVQKAYEKKWFQRELENTEKVSGQITAKTVSKNGPDSGIHVSQVSKNSIFEKLGIKKNDRIIRVNGAAVNSVSEFIDSLYSNSDTKIIQVEKYNSDGLIDPFYIQLN